jgi:hypothetical protein
LFANAKRFVVVREGIVCSAHTGIDVADLDERHCLIPAKLGVRRIRCNHLLVQG